MRDPISMTTNLPSIDVHRVNTTKHLLNKDLAIACNSKHITKSSDPFVLKAREFFLIQKFDTYNNGLNKEPSSTK